MRKKSGSVADKIRYIFEEAIGRVSLQDQEFKSADDGPILKDRETDEKWRLYVENGTIKKEKTEGY